MNANRIFGVLVAALVLGGCDPEAGMVEDEGRSGGQCYDDPGALLGPVVVDRDLVGYVAWEHETDGPVMGFEFRDGVARCWNIDDGYDKEIELAPKVVMERRIGGYVVLWGAHVGYGCFVPERYRQSELVKIQVDDEELEGAAFQAAV